MAAPTFDVQYSKIKELCDAQLVANTFWAVVSSRWWNSWKEFCSYDAPAAAQVGAPPGPIENSDICDVSARPAEFAGVIKLREGIQEREDYVLVPEEAWTVLHDWYGGGPHIARRVIEQGGRNDRIVDLFPLHICVMPFAKSTKLPDSSKGKSMTVARSRTLAILRFDATNALQLGPNDTRMWRFDSAVPISLTDLTLIKDEELALQLSDLGFKDFTYIAIEEKDKLLSLWPTDAPVTSATGSVTAAYTSGVAASRTPLAGTTAYSGYSAYGAGSYYSSTPGTPVQRGVTGLANLGNTCFMASGVQCLSNAAALQKYFTSNAYVSELNATNALGTGGKLASVYASLLTELWSGTFTSVSPSKFKSVIGQFAPQFSGYQQQDAQELVGFLLDGLHEDLNRVVDKPPTEKLESDGSPDAIIAAESWRRHLLRNQSIIVDLFQGQFKSTVVCPEADCGRVSVTFDPFMYLQVPLPAQNDRQFICVVVPADPAVPVARYAVMAPKNGTVAELMAAVAAVTGMRATHLAVADHYGGRLFSIRESWRSLRELRPEANVVYETALPMPDKPKPSYSYASYSTPYYLAPARPAVPPPAAPPPPTVAVAQVLMRALKPALYSAARKEVSLFGTPMLVTYTKGQMTNAQMLALVVDTIEARSCRGPLDRAALPFTVLVVNTVGLQCGRCSYASACTGCALPANDEPCDIDYDGRLCLALHWTEQALVDVYDDSRSSLVTPRDDASVAATNPAAGGGRLDALELTACLEAFSRAETLSANDTWYCSKCRELRQATKRMEIYALPDVLVIHLKRFQYDNQYREKISTLVEYPLEGLDLSRFVVDHTGPAPIYDLFAVSLHSGGLGGGHYTAIARNHIDGKFYAYNDSRAYAMDGVHGVVTPEAYLLFYERRSARLAREADPNYTPAVKVPPPPWGGGQAPASAGAAAAAASASAGAGASSS